MLRRYIGKVQTYLWSLLYEYRCAADWGTDTGLILTLRMNKWTKTVKVIDRTVINEARASYRTA